MALNLRANEQIHTRERRFVCQTSCHNRFNQASVLRRHKRYYSTKRDEQSERRHVNQIQYQVHVCFECEQLFHHRLNTFKFPLGISKKCCRMKQVHYVDVLVKHIVAIFVPPNRTPLPLPIAQLRWHERTGGVSLWGVVRVGVSTNSSPLQDSASSGGTWPPPPIALVVDWHWGE